jgi:tryptophan-rich sensory protein
VTHTPPATAPASLLDPGGASPSATPFASRRGRALAAIAATSVLVTSTAGRIVSARSVAGWYKTIAKPSFNPPNWAFPVAWSLLFVLMGVAFWRVLRQPPSTRSRTAAIALFSVQLVVNVGWSTAFFGARSPLAGLVVIVPFWLLILATIRTFHRVDRPAAWLLVPYAAWVAFATVLNAAIVRLN